MAGLSGSIDITQKGSLGSICDPYYHKDIIANILSVSAITSMGHIIAYDNTADSFSISHPDANCSTVHNSKLLSNISTCNPVTLDGLSGSIDMTQKESLGSKCDAYYHKDIIVIERLVLNVS